ncbi:hypothetical protein [Oceanirhabdus sp. W0125-5]|uniref:hypothetical protein n=1 Tax=Oceanirhabdus sp. W0125-5 TaxID=2999116 RepID=UPI0022F2E490|nr:hypothetical protein [Oceanirhabdus sp. W0125-5]WBW99311.1 hypothetical protein OW730_11340 [Oceanirhabdus sp. W0125-5]
MLEVVLIVLIILVIYNIVVYIPNKLKEQEERISLHFKELYIRLNKIEKILEDNNKKEF